MVQGKEAMVQGKEAMVLSVAREWHIAGLAGGDYFLALATDSLQRED